MPTSNDSIARICNKCSRLLIKSDSDTLEELEFEDHILFKKFSFNPNDNNSWEVYFCRDGYVSLVNSCDEECEFIKPDPNNTASKKQAKNNFLKNSKSNTHTIAIRDDGRLTSKNKG